MAGLRALWPAMESSPEREEMRREKSRGQGGGTGVGRLLAVGGGGMPCGELRGHGALGPARRSFSIAFLGKKRKEEREKRRKKGRKK
jgi:hypothetical protein